MPKSRELIASIARRRWTAEDARLVLKALAESGLSVRAFAEREGLDPQRVQFWKRRLGSDSAGTSLALIEVAPRTSADLVEVALVSGRVLRVPASIDTGALRRIVAVLEEGDGC